ncbi:CR3L1-like protein [Mya arenaria]|uniref:CR3L1-like protein n=1 Tax=Mya arenaria TaxID=6604 RepID=A0ABY7EIW3_MYAAR|nr:cyclic AMP-responsive element-binding protein 3-like protein 2 [Mya arenaria]WAR08588.1 CR3L1-like protein [Mya arenaria]
MDLLYGSDQKFNDLDEDMNTFLDNDVFQSPATTEPGYMVDEEWFDSFFVDPVLNDKMITDAAQPPRIKCEHSYSSVNENSLASSGEMDDIGRLEDLESELLLRNAALDLTMKPGNSQTLKPETIETDPLTATQTGAPTIPARTFTVTKQQPTIILASTQPHTHGFSERSVLPRITVKTEPPDAYDIEPRVNVDSLVLPPTPPSSSNCSDSDSCPSPQRSAPSSPSRSSYGYGRERPSLSPPSSRYSPWSSNQTEGVDIVFQQIPTSGILVLTEEEKRTLISEGYPIPSKLPLTKQEEKNLKKIRRKIKNKISAQESRRKKKEYLEALEKRVESFSQENCDLKKKVDTLENSNRSLLSQLQKLQNLVGKIPRPNVMPQTGLMVLVLCFAVFVGSWSPVSLNVGYGSSHSAGLKNDLPFANPQLVKPAPMMGPQLEAARVDAYCTPPMKSRVLMSLRGEQDDLTWYDIYGPNVPYAELDRETGEPMGSTYSNILAKPAPVKSDNTIPVPDKNSLYPAENDANTAVTLISPKSDVVEVTVDGRFGHVNTSRDEPTKTGAHPKPHNGAESLMESADTI